VITSFRNRQTEEIFDAEGRRSKAALKVLPSELWTGAQRKMAFLDSVTRLTDLALFGLEKLRKDRTGQHSIRINDQYRICFEWTEAGPREVEITDYH
jgi:toxin HigB-1